MCGITGYAGRRQAVPILLDSLSKLEYRGYDSAGVCIQSENGLQVEKAKGRLACLREKIDGGKKLSGTVGIGHTRWATHGAPSDINSHPHLSNSGKIAVVHNGIIENEAVLRKMLEHRGFSFRSETDTEVIANLIDYHYCRCGSFVRAVRLAMTRLEGSFALGILCEDLPGTIIAVKKDTPLIFGFGEGENYIASDVTAMVQYTQTVAYLDDGEMAVFDAGQVTFYDAAGNVIEKQRETVVWNKFTAERDGYDHFMLKEILEQPEAVRNTIHPYLRDGKISFEGAELPADYLKKLKKIYLVGCGSAYYAAVLGKYILEKTCRISAEAMQASEFRYCDSVADGSDLVILLSQSGETADTLAALREAKRRGAETLAIVNVVGSAIAKSADRVIYTWVGQEIAVATTKAFSAQLAVIHLLALHMARNLGTVNEADAARLVTALEQLPGEMERVLEQENLHRIRQLSNLYCGRQHVLYIGRNMDSAICMEGSLKLKEVAYLHSEAYPAGELKHGPIAMIEKGTLVIALATVEELFEKTMANVKAVKARGAYVLCVTTQDREREAAQIAEHVIAVPSVHPVLRPGLALLILQLLAYYVAVSRGCDVDKPRNLAKSVTVE